MNEESFIVYEHHSYDMIRTWRSLGYQCVDYHLEMIEEQARMNEAMHMVVNPLAYKMRCFPQWQLKDEF